MMSQLERRNAQEQRHHTSLTPAAFNSKTPQSTMVPTPHSRNRLQNATMPGLPNALQSVSTPSPARPFGTLSSGASFAVIINSPSNGLANPALNGLSAASKKRRRSFENSHRIAARAPAKKKGRPFKNSEAAAAAAHGSRGASTDTGPKKRGRPYKHPRGPEQLIPVVPPEPKFVPFTCEWKNCPAELHNLDTLRAHLETVHLKKQLSASHFMCLWGKCSQEYKHMDENGHSKVTCRGVVFSTKEEWQNHVKVAHLDVVARWQGDGPKTGMSFYQKPTLPFPYSFRYGGPEGQITPSVRNQPVEDGYAKENNLGRFRKKRDGPYVVYEPLEDPKLYMKDDDN